MLPIFLIDGASKNECPSIRKIGSMYYFIYSSEVMHELCYAVSKSPVSGFSYAGVLVSNCDLHISSYKPADKIMAYGGNNHGSICQINNEWYIFYHRHTNGTWYSRQGCAERLEFKDGIFKQAEITSCGLNNGPLDGIGIHPAYIACHLYTDKPEMYSGDSTFPKITQDGRDGDEETGYVANIQDTTTIGFKYFQCKNIKNIKIWTRGYIEGVFEVRLAWDGDILAKLPVESSNIWAESGAAAAIPDGVWPVYLTFKGHGNGSLKAFGLY